MITFWNIPQKFAWWMITFWAILIEHCRDTEPNKLLRSLFQVGTGGSVTPIIRNTEIRLIGPF